MMTALKQRVCASQKTLLLFEKQNVVLYHPIQEKPLFELAVLYVFVMAISYVYDLSRKRTT
jgi:hypothetical protein